MQVVKSVYYIVVSEVKVYESTSSYSALIVLVGWLTEFIQPVRSRTRVIP